jgi:hypothetical protein
MPTKLSMEFDSALDIERFPIPTPGKGDVPLVHLYFFYSLGD